MKFISEIYSKFSGLARLLSLGSRAENKFKELLLRSPLFDEAYYLDQYGGDVARSGLDPATHYLRYGSLKDFNPSEEFDASLYLAEYPDVRKAKINPLLHYLGHGQYEGRPIRRVAPTAPKPKAPTAAQWDEFVALEQRSYAGTPVLDIIIPVYLGFDETANCIYSVLRSRQVGATSCEVVVVDDASPEPGLSALLDGIASRGLITLLRNEENSGFVASVNRGMALHEDRDVILLNSDTAVFGDWIERLRRVAYSDSKIGTVTPFSNNASICSYPNFPGEFRGAFEISFEELDRLAGQVNAGKIVDLPTAIGFCMFIRRECIAEVGYFDVEAFGQGYGEENDFCLRIAAKGWRNVLAGEVFVRHLGRVSFLDSTNDRVQQALKIIHRRYPIYLADVGIFIKTDPPKPLRRNIDVERLRRLAGPRTFLFVLHNLGGGTLKHVCELSDRLVAEGIGVLWLQPDLKDGVLAVIRHARAQNLSNGAVIDLRGSLPDAASLLRELGVVHIHVHHVLGFMPGFASFISALAAECSLRYDVTIHDYTFVCPRVNMIDGSGRYCGNMDVVKCEDCVQINGSPLGVINVAGWRTAHKNFLSKARRVLVPNIDTKTRLNDFFPHLDIQTREHPEPLPENFAAPVIRQSGEPLRVAIIGAIGPHKGSFVLLKCAEDAHKRHLPIQFHVFGYSDKTELGNLPNVSFSGKYTEDQLEQLLARNQCHVAFFPAVWPETYSYTLSQAWFAGLYPVAFDIGAIAERIRRSSWGHLLPFDLVTRPAEINDALLSPRPPHRPDSFVPVTGTHLYKSILVDYYEMDMERAN